MEFSYPVSKFLLRIVLRLFADWTVEGIENVPPMGPLMVVANHQSNIDPPLLSVSIPRRLHFLAKDEIFKGPILSAFLRNYGAFPLARSGKELRALHWAIGQLKQDKVITLFPEGTRHPHGMKRAASAGVASIALHSQTPILPVAITGTERLGSVLRVAFPTGKLKVIIGQPFSLPVIEGRLPREQLHS